MSRAFSAIPATNPSAALNSDVGANRQRFVPTGFVGPLATERRDDVQPALRAQAPFGALWRSGHGRRERADRPSGAAYPSEATGKNIYRKFRFHFLSPVRAFPHWSVDLWDVWMISLQSRPSSLSFTPVSQVRFPHFGVFARTGQLCD